MSVNLDSVPWATLSRLDVFAMAQRDPVCRFPIAVNLHGTAPGRTSRRWARFGVTGTAEILLRLLVAGKVRRADIERLGASVDV